MLMKSGGRAWTVGFDRVKSPELVAPVDELGVYDPGIAEEEETDISDGPSDGAQAGHGAC